MGSRYQRAAGETRRPGRKPSAFVGNGLVGGAPETKEKKSGLRGMRPRAADNGLLVYFYFIGIIE
jgi:hypothetical protein